MSQIQRIGLTVLLAGLAIGAGGAQAAPPAGGGGARMSDFDIQMDPTRMEEFNLDQQDVSRQIERQLDRLPRNLPDEPFLDAVRRIPIVTPSGKKILLGEVARIKRKSTTSRPVTAKIGIQLDQDKLDQYKLDAQSVNKQMRAQIKAVTIEELNKVIIETPDGRKVKLNQIATFEVTPVPGRKTEPKEDPSEGVKPVALDDPADAPAAKVALAVVPFQVLGNVRVKDAGAILAERLLPFFAEKYQLIDQTQLQQFRDQDALTMADLVALAQPSDKKRPQAMRLRAVNVLVVGSISSAPDGLTVTARLSDWQSGQVKGLAFIRASDWESLMGRLPYLASKLTGQSLAQTQAMVPFGELEFRVVANLPDSDNEPSATEPEIQAMLQRLKGNYAPKAGDKYVWAELKCEGQGFVIAKFRGKQLGLLSNQPKYAMPAGQKDEQAWYIERAAAGKDETGQPNVSIRLDRQGAALMAKLTKANVGNRLAIVVDGKVISAPTVQSAISRDAVITGIFSEKDVRDLAAAINQTMRRPPAAKPSESAGE